MYERRDEHHDGIPVTSTLLIELRELRTDFNTHARALERRLGRLESSMDNVVGDKQPGRLTILENKFSDLSAWRWKMIGIMSGLSAAVGVAFHFWKPA